MLLANQVTSILQLECGGAIYILMESRVEVSFTASWTPNTILMFSLIILQDHLLLNAPLHNSTERSQLSVIIPAENGKYNWSNIAQSGPLTGPCHFRLTIICTDH